MIMSPKAKILLYILLAVVVFASNSYKVNLALICIVAAFAARVPLSSLKRGIIPIAIFLTFTFISNVLLQEGEAMYTVLGLSVTYEGLVLGGELSLRLIILILGAKILTATTRAEELVRGIGELLGPVGRLAYTKELIYTMSLTLRMLPIVYDEAIESYKSIKNSNEPGLTGKIKLAVELLTTLLERSLERAREMAEKEEEAT